MRGWRCSRCGTDHIEPQANLFRYNSPWAPARLRGFGRTIELDLARIVPDRSKTIRDGAIAPWSTRHIGACSTDLLGGSPRALGIPVDVPFERLEPGTGRAVVEGVPGSGFRASTVSSEGWSSGPTSCTSGSS